MMLNVIYVLEFIMKVYSSFTLLIVVLLSACGTVEVSIERSKPGVPTPIQTATPAAVTPTSVSSETRAIVVYVQEGNVFVWEEGTGQSKTSDALTKDLLQLCPDPSRDSKLSENTLVAGVMSVQWLDGRRALLLTNASCVLLLSSLNGQPILNDLSISFDDVLIEQE
jgi:hypothetical protein